MFPSRKPAEKTELEKSRDKALEVLNNLGTDDPGYKPTVKTVKMLSEAIAQETPVREPININTLLPAIATVFSVIVIVASEQHHVVNSKALQFLPKLLR